MNYAVTWERIAEAQLAALWIRSANKSAVTGYIDQIDRALERDPHGQGESRNAGTRLAFFRPLAVRFHVDDTRRVVTVTAVKWVGR